ncbi:MAG: FAD-linked oxidase [SAR324 cluster bacterium]|uniref:FAD-linked oxidase n=1 Tax=SAR324 cluster bacterium TaxID=2024889 RepID=A0A2A4SPQ1_9DELT|nr:MAG: FAD-linked oxidase [SAR324 cluster bacterium]
MKLAGWGKFPIIDSEPHWFENETQLKTLVQRRQEYIVFALGRSYGDSALAAHTIQTQTWNHILDFDEDQGVLTCESGLSLADIIDVFLPRGWFLSVSPGTKFITVGGAIASDVHGKNHHLAGCFSESVLSFELMSADGELLPCSREQNPSLFHATCGGMGLTGVITRAKIKLMKIPSAQIRQTTFKARNLKETFELFFQYKHVPYSVAWVDCLARGEKLGRSLLMVGDHDPEGTLDRSEKLQLSIPLDFPRMALNKYTVSAFNQLYYNRITKPRTCTRVDLESFFYPLDSIHHWNRMYGASGFTQYQFVLPHESSFSGLSKILGAISQSGLGSFLSVLKLLGKENKNLLSFPKEGFTLALDFKMELKLLPLLSLLDRIVLDHGGRFYLAKDVRLDVETFRAGYPRLQEFEAIREKYGCKEKFQSLQSKRLKL